MNEWQSDPGGSGVTAKYLDIIANAQPLSQQSLPTCDHHLTCDQQFKWTFHLPFMISFASASDVTSQKDHFQNTRKPS